VALSTRTRRSSASRATLSLLVVFVLFLLGQFAAAASSASGLSAVGVSGHAAVTAGIEPDVADATVDDSVDGSGDGSIVENPLGSADDEDRGSSASEDRKIWAVIGGLVLVALALTAITVRYWRQTRPAPKPAKTGSGGRRARSAEEPDAFDDLGSDLFVDGD